ncbi:MAG: hypothetical protein R3F07_16870 [Opitutaceae bacterium]
MPSESIETGSGQAEAFGFSPDATGLENAAALQRALDQGGTITVTRPGTYKLAATVLIGSDTAVRFGTGVFIQKVNEQGPFTHVLLNRGALTRTWDRNIVVDGLHVIVNGLDHAMSEIYGLRGQLAFSYVRDLRVTRFRCLDLGKTQFAIHVCTFEDIIIDDVRVTGDKDGVHLGRGRRFTIRNGVFKTFDDAVALNGHDYASGNPELGWIEDGVIENCHDLPDEKEPIGFFCRILAGAWIDWTATMEVQNSDSVVSEGRLYRVQAKPDGTTWKSLTRPTHESGAQILDGINWGVVQADGVHSAGVRNITFRDIFLSKPRIAFSVHFDNDRYSRSYYPGAEIPIQEQITLDSIRVLHDAPVDLVSIDTPVDVLTIAHSTIRQNGIRFLKKSALGDHGRTSINLVGCVFAHDGQVELVTNRVPGKEIILQTTASIAPGSSFSASVDPGEARLLIQADLPGLKPMGS